MRIDLNVGGAGVTVPLLAAVLKTLGRELKREGKSSAVSYDRINALADVLADIEANAPPKGAA